MPQKKPSIGLLGGSYYHSNLHILARFVITGLAFGSMVIFDLLKKWPFYRTHIAHYIVTMAAILLLAFLAGFFLELHPQAYRDIFLNYTVIYAGIVMIELVFYFWKRRRLTVGK